MPMNYTRTDIGRGQAAVPLSDGSTLIVTFSNVVSAGYGRSTTRNFTAGPDATFANELNLVQQRLDGSTDPYRGQTVTIAFNRPVFNLIVPISALSWPNTSDRYSDAVWVDPLPTSVVKGANVEGTGNPATPFWNINMTPNTTDGTTGPSTRATMTYSGGSAGLSSIKVHYFDAESGTGHAIQGISIRDLTMDVKKIGCP